MKLLDKLKSEIEQRNNKPFLKAAMGVCALTASADGVVSLEERYRIDAVLERVKELRIYDPHKAIVQLNLFLDGLKHDPEETKRVLTTKIARYRDDYKSARTLLRIAYLVMSVDEEITETERAAFDEICVALAVDPSEVFDKMAAETR